MTDNGEVVKFVYGDGLIGEERSGAFRTYHFDYRGSTVAISNDCGSVSDRFEYDSYGRMTSHIGSGSVIFGYNGRDGVVTDENGLIYMRARYYAPSLKRFVNADIIAGEISNAVTLNRYAYANGNPVSNVDPFGLSADNKGISDEDINEFFNMFGKIQNEKSKASAASLLEYALSMLMQFGDQYKLTSKASKSIPLGPDAALSYYVSSSFGAGDKELAATISNQIDLLSSYSFKAENTSIIINREGICISYSEKVNEYTSVSASISSTVKNKASFSYKVSTNDGLERSTSFGVSLDFKRNIKPNNNRPTPKAEVQENTALESFLAWGTNAYFDVNNFLSSPEFLVGAGTVLITAAAATDCVGFFLDDAVLLPLGTYLIGSAATA